MLGPPKTAFASASGARNGNKTLESSNRTTYGPVDDEAVKNDRFHTKERHNKDAHKAEKEGDKSRDTRLGNLHNRRGIKDDNEPWSGARQQKGFSHDDANNGRNGGRDKDRENGGREPRIQRGFDHRRDVDREGNGDNATRRNAPGRGRFEPSWYRDDDRQEGESQKGGKDTTKPRDWRDKERGGLRGPDREWNKAVKPEQDPEWMDEPEPEEKKQTHTQEDFQRWKERMKATNGPNQDLPLSPTEQRPNHERTLSNLSASAGKGKFETPLIADPHFDGFFGLWSENNKDLSKQGVQEQSNNTVNKPNAPKPSKFTGFFSPKPVPELPEPEPSQPPQPIEATKDSSNEDKEGFQRILKLLDQQQPNSGRAGSSVREKAPRDIPSSQSAHPPRSRESGGLESLLGSQHPKDAPLPQNRDSEYLLKLMQQTQQARPNVNHSNSNNQRLDGGPAPGILPFLISPREPNQHTSGAGLPPGFVNDSTREELQHRDRLNPTVPSERKGMPLGYFGGYPDILPRNSGAGVISQSALSSGLQRPPGLEQAPNVYVQNMQSQRQGMVPPPPGFPAPIRAHNPFPPGLMPNISNSNNPNERGPPYGLRAVGPTGPTAMSPPGFMTMNPPPPGFPPAPFNQEGRMSPPGRLYYGPGTQRQPMDGFGEAANNFGMGGQGILPGQYRRQE